MEEKLKKRHAEKEEKSSASRQAKGRNSSQTAVGGNYTHQQGGSHNEYSNCVVINISPEESKRFLPAKNNHSKTKKAFQPVQKIRNSSLYSPKNALVISAYIMQLPQSFRIKLSKALQTDKNWKFAVVEVCSWYLQNRENGEINSLEDIYFVLLANEFFKKKIVSSIHQPFDLSTINFEVSDWEKSLYLTGAEKREILSILNNGDMLGLKNSILNELRIKFKKHYVQIFKNNVAERLFTIVEKLNNQSDKTGDYFFYESIILHYIEQEKEDLIKNATMKTNLLCSFFFLTSAHSQNVVNLVIDTIFLCVKNNLAYGASYSWMNYVLLLIANIQAPVAISLIENITEWANQCLANVVGSKKNIHIDLEKSGIVLNYVELIVTLTVLCRIYKIKIDEEKYFNEFKEIIMAINDQSEDDLSFWLTYKLLQVSFFHLKQNKENENSELINHADILFYIKQIMAFHVIECARKPQEKETRSKESAFPTYKRLTQQFFIALLEEDKSQQVLFARVLMNLEYFTETLGVLFLQDIMYFLFYYSYSKKKINNIIASIYHYLENLQARNSHTLLYSVMGFYLKLFNPKKNIHPELKNSYKKYIEAIKINKKIFNFSFEKNEKKLTQKKMKKILNIGFNFSNPFTSEGLDSLGYISPRGKADSSRSFSSLPPKINSNFGESLSKIPIKDSLEEGFVLQDDNFDARDLENIEDACQLEKDIKHILSQERKKITFFNITINRSKYIQKAREFFNQKLPAATVRMFSIVGNPGVGKTALANQIALTFQQENLSCATIYIDVKYMHSELYALAEKIVEKINLEKMKEKFFQRRNSIKFLLNFIYEVLSFSFKEKVTIIFDNFNESKKEKISDFFPPNSACNNFNIIIISRDHINDLMVGTDQCVGLDGFDEEEITALVDRFFNKKPSSLKSEMIKIGNSYQKFPIIVTILFSLYAQRNYSPNELTFSGPLEEEDYADILEKCITPIINKYIQQDKNSLDSLIFLTISAKKNIDFNILCEILNKPIAAPALKKSILLLRKYNLIFLSNAEQCISIPDLLSIAVTWYFIKNNIKLYITNINEMLENLDALFQFEANDESTFLAVVDIFPHVLAAQHAVFELKNNFKLSYGLEESRIASLLWKIAVFYGIYDKNNEKDEFFCEKLIDFYNQNKMKKDYIYFRTRLGGMSYIYLARRNYKKTMENCEKVLQEIKDTSALRTDEKDILFAIAEVNYCLGLDKSGDSSSVKIFKESLEKKFFNYDCSESINILKGRLRLYLARANFNAGRYDEAEKECHELFMTCKDNFDVIIGAQIIKAMLLELDAITRQESLKIWQEVFAKIKEKFSSRKFGFLNIFSYPDVPWLPLSILEWEDENFFSEKINLISSLYGEEHIEMAKCYLDMGEFYFKKNKFILANNYFEKGQQLCKPILGESHINTKLFLHKIEETKKIIRNREKLIFWGRNIIEGTSFLLVTSLCSFEIARRSFD